MLAAILGGLASGLGSAALGYALSPDQPKPPPQQVPIQSPPPYQPSPQQNSQFDQLVAKLSQLDRGY